MVVKRNALGRNLSALLGQTTQTIQEASSEPINKKNLLSLAVTCLQPGKYQPRTDMDEASLTELASSIKQQGLLQPLIVREIAEDRYEIIAGERRWRASQLAGLTEVSVIIHQVDDETAMAVALVENLQREDLNAIDQARAMHRLTEEFSLTHQQVADLLGKSRTAVSNFLRLLSLSAEVKRALEYGDLDMGHARALLILAEEQQWQVAQLIIAKNLSVRETEKLVNRVRSAPATKQIITQEHTIDLQPHLQKLAQHLQAKVNIKQNKQGKGSLIIHYNSPLELETFIRQITN